MLTATIVVLLGIFAGSALGAAMASRKYALAFLWAGTLCMYAHLLTLLDVNKPEWYINSWAWIGLALWGIAGAMRLVDLRRKPERDRRHI